MTGPVAPLFCHLPFDWLLKAYNQELQRFNRVAIVNLTKQDIKEYVGPVGPVRYVTHHRVHKNSSTTPQRVVTNTIFTNINVGVSRMTRCIGGSQ